MSVKTKSPFQISSPSRRWPILTLLAFLVFMLGLAIAPLAFADDGDGGDKAQRNKRRPSLENKDKKKDKKHGKKAQREKKRKDKEHGKHDDDDDTDAGDDIQPPPTTQPSHAGRFTTYEGSKTCNVCHLGRAYEVHESVHYQWKGATPDVVNMTEGGKLGSINDFCTYPDTSFAFKMNNADGAQVVTGCVKCHAGLGEIPSPDPTPSQLENIDCLVCHSDSYKRKLTETADGQFRLVPDAASMTVSLEEAITDITKPSKGVCLSCHANAGGGNGLKQGDLEMSLADPPRTLDVHMASPQNGGAGLDCVDCHATQAHKIAGRGDVRPTDLDVAVNCTSCHRASPHDNSELNRHTARVDCTTCHIPSIARGVPTDVLRDFTESELDANKRTWEPAIIRETNVIPQYKFYNGTSYFYKFGDPIDSPETHVISEPIGDISDPAAKIHPVKFHAGVMAYDLEQLRLIPVSAQVLWSTGDVDAAIRQGASSVGWSLDSEYDYVHTERYMPVFHEVAPKEDALSCNECHEGNRLDFNALGYTPKAQRNGSPLCTSCHEDESDEWSASEFFTGVHKQHVNEKNISCSECHNF
ncbi:MAG: hypothetical protein Kow0099_21440 [Candidatus Abyssubacteria bacterium]